MQAKKYVYEYAISRDKKKMTSINLKTKLCMSKVS